MIDWAKTDFAKRGIDSPRVDAEWLLADMLGLTRIQLYLDLDRPLSEAELGSFKQLVARRRRREPVAYILGHAGFFTREFQVSPAVLVPRPDSETLIRRVLELPSDQTLGPALDLCTGSGALGLTLAAERPTLEVDLTDLSDAALEVARANARALHVSERVRFFQGDLLAALPGDRRYGLVVANPPYIAEDEVADLMPEVSEHEPRLALVAGEGGYAFYRRLSQELPTVLAPGARVLLEVGQGQAPRVMALFQKSGAFRDLLAHVDFGGIDRVVEVVYHPVG